MFCITKKASIAISILLVLVIFIFSQCNDNDSKIGSNNGQKDSAVVAKNYGGFNSQLEWGGH